MTVIDDSYHYHRNLVGINVKLMCLILIELFTYGMGKKMKNQHFVVWGCVLLLLLFFGCAGNPMFGNRSSGSVLDQGKGETPKFKVVTFEVIGKGLEPENALTIGEAKIMAERAAVADGYRKLVEEIRGVYVDAYLKTGNGYVNYDMVQTHTQSWLRGAEVISTQVVEHNITEARIQLRINFVYDQMVWWPVGLGTDYTSSGRSPSYSQSPVSSR